MGEALEGVDAVCHLAAAVGVGQSMYEIERYTAVNDLGTAVLLEAMMASDVRRLLIASSMSIYGEGLTRGPGGLCDPPQRSLDQLKAGRWELEATSGESLEPVPTPETKTPALGSIYPRNKFNHRSGYVPDLLNAPMASMWWRRASSTSTDRTGDSPNPYTPACFAAIFAARLLNRKPPLVFEDGDAAPRFYVHVPRHVARACRLALETPSAAAGEVINDRLRATPLVRLLDVARLLSEATGHENIAAECTGKYRVGDIRHCFADISLARRLLGFEPQVAFGDGLAELADWLSTQIAIDRVDQATDELARRGLVV